MLRNPLLGLTVAFVGLILLFTATLARAHDDPGAPLPVPSATFEPSGPPISDHACDPPLCHVVTGQ